MTLLAQHGWGKTLKITKALGSGSIGGLILSPRDETPENAAAVLESIAGDHPDATRLFDPLFHAGQVVPANVGKLPDYSYYRPNLARRDFIGASKFAGYAADVLGFQYTLNVTSLVAPTIELVNFGDSSAQIALQLADASSTHHASTDDKRSLLLSFLINENALQSLDELDAFLDAITVMNADGYYLMMSRASSTHNALIEPSRLAALMYMVYILRVVNGFDVYCGYSDLIGLPLHAAGATASACGWYGTLRRFTFNRFRKSKGGRRPRPRYLSTPVLESILISEMDQISQAGLIDEFISGTSYDNDFRTKLPFTVAWPDEDAALHHWEALAAKVNEIESLTVDDALKKLVDWIDTAEAIRSEAEIGGVQFEPPSGDHLDMWRLAIQQFREMAELT
ncbi:MAG: hypothetical protein HND58_15325 [Planctomycetota bacterium]|nr:MAG: hypothetical protein HND58_15325 [Planctomycetota bacterium]